MNNWRATIEIWPHSTGNGQENDQKLCGGRKHEFEINATSFDQASAMAHWIMKGMKTNPAVWETRIVAMVEAKP